jgi:hypothetical protein
MAKEVLEKRMGQLMADDIRQGVLGQLIEAQADAAVVETDRPVPLGIDPPQVLLAVHHDGQAGRPLAELCGECGTGCFANKRYSALSRDRDCDKDS